MLTEGGWEWWRVLFYLGGVGRHLWRNLKRFLLSRNRKAGKRNVWRKENTLLPDEIICSFQNYLSFLSWFSQHHLLSFFSGFCDHAVQGLGVSHVLGTDSFPQAVPNTYRPSYRLPHGHYTCILMSKTKCIIFSSTPQTWEPSILFYLDYKNVTTVLSLQSFLQPVCALQHRQRLNTDFLPDKISMASHGLQQKVQSSEPQPPISASFPVIPPTFSSLCPTRLTTGQKHIDLFDSIHLQVQCSHGLW